MSRGVVLGCGGLLPDRVIRNADLAEQLETTEASILADTGVRERRWAEAGRAPSDLAAGAAAVALDRAGLGPADVDLIVFATMTPDIAFPGSGCFLQDKLGCRTIGALDVRAQCAGFVFALATADRFLRTGKAGRALVCGGDVHSSGLDQSPTGRTVTPRFGDGAGVVLLGVGDGDRGVLSTVLHSDPAGYRRFWCEFPASRHYPARMQRAQYEAGRHYPVLDAEGLAAQAETSLCEVAAEALRVADVTTDAVRLAIMHYIDPRVAMRAAGRVGFRDDSVVAPAATMGHIASGGIPIALAQAIEAQRVAPGDVVVCAAFGAGVSWAASVVRL